MKSLRVVGDTIEYNFIPVARFIPGAQISAAAYAAEEIDALDPESAESEHAKELTALEDEHAREIEERYLEIETLTARVAELERELDDLDGEGSALTQRLDALKDDAAHWRDLAHKYADHIRALQAPKPRKRKTL